MIMVMVSQTEVTIVKYTDDEKALNPEEQVSSFLIGQAPNICSNLSNGQYVVSMLAELILVRTQDTN